MSTTAPISVVTGAAGFIASHLCEALLARGHHVVGIDGFTDTYDVNQKRGNADELAGSDRFRMVEGLSLIHI